MEDKQQQAMAAAEGGRNRRVAYVALAGLLHLVAAVFWAGRPSPVAPEVTVLPRLNLAEHRQAIRRARQAMQAAQTPRKRPEAPVPPPKPPPEKPLQGMVVDIPPSPDSVAPEHAAYLAERNAHTEHETRSRDQSPDYQNVMHERTTRWVKPVEQAARQPSSGAAEPRLQRKAETDEKAAVPLAGPTEVPRQAPRDRLALHIDERLGGFDNQGETEGIVGNSERLRLSSSSEVEAQAGQAAADTAALPGRKLTLDDLVPSVGTLARLSGGAFNDALQGVEVGDGTFLNAREFKYAAFFGRIKRSISHTWRPTDEYQRRDPTGEIYGHRSRTTAVQVTLGPGGDLKDIRLAQSSGVAFLDQQALHAFTEAAPFPNPPRGLLDTAGQLQFQFSFVLDFSGQGFFEAPY